MDDNLMDRVHRQMLLVVSTVALAGLALMPWWEERRADGDVTVSGWSLLGGVIRAHNAGDDTDAVGWFIAGYVMFALVVLCAGAVVPPGSMSPGVGVFFGLVAGCLGIGLCLMDLVIADRSEDTEIFGAYRAAWITALVVSGFWFAWAGDRRQAAAAR